MTPHCNLGDCPIVVPHAHGTGYVVATAPPALDHEPFTYTSWDEIPWKDGCPECDHIRGEGPKPSMAAVINHWAVCGKVTPTRTRPGDQVLPDGDESKVDDQSLLIADIEARRLLGIERYGQGHRPFNGRSTLTDMYDEQLDFLVYLRSIKRMADATRDDLIEVVSRAYDAIDRDDNRIPGVVAEVVVDRIMGWVVGARLLSSGASPDVSTVMHVLETAREVNADDKMVAETLVRLLKP